VSLRTAAVGTPPLQYQWRFNGTNLPAGTNSVLAFQPLGPEHAGVYDARVENTHGSTISLPATVSVSTTSMVGLVQLQNFAMGIRNPIYDVDGATRLSGESFMCQPYAGVTSDQMVALGTPAPLRTGQTAGYISSMTLIIPFPELAVEPAVYVQLRVWESAFGGSYEEARARGGKFGGSPLVRTNATEPLFPPPTVYLPSFNLRAGLPEFTTGRLASGDRLPNGQREWVLTGAPGFSYLVERKEPQNNWSPLVILTNGSGTVTFTDPGQTSASAQFYRARMLD
jgi:hypothetical protein